MATWTYDITDNIGKVRLMIGDTDISPTSDAQFTDEEITYFLTANSNNLNLAAADALEAWIGKLSRNPNSEKIGDYSYTMKSIENMNKLRNELRAKVENSPVFEWSEIDLTSGSGITVEED